jgi:hypothetical protein
MPDTPLQSIQKFQTDATILDNFLNADANTQVDFSAAQDGSDMRASLEMLLANMGLRPPTKGPVAAMQTAALDPNTYNNGAGGVGATITANANGAFPAATIDNVAPVVGLRVLITSNGQAKAGVYVFTQVGGGGAPWILTRDTDADSAAELGYMLVFVAGGATEAGTAWLIPISGANIVVGTTPLSFVQIPETAAVAAEIARAEAAETAIANGLRSCALTQAANFNLDGTAELWPVDDSGGNIIGTVPAGAGFPNQEWTVKKIKNSANTTTITMSGADTLDGAATFVLHNQWAAVTFENKRGSAIWYVKSLYLT